MPNTWNQEKVDSLLGGIGLTMRQRTPSLEEVIISFLIAVIVFFVVRYIVRQYQAAVREKSIYRRSILFSEEVQNAGLTPSQVSLLRELSSHLDDPELDAILLFSDVILFSGAKRKLLEGSPDRSVEFPALELKMGFPTKEEGKIIRSASELPLGSTVLISEYGEFKIVGIHSSGLELASADALPVATPLRVEARRKDGIYKFESILTETNDGKRLLHFPNLIDRVERRMFFRKDVSLLGFVDGNPVSISNLGGGGALVNSRNVLYDGAELSFELPLLGKLKFRFRIVDQNQDYYRVAFLNMRTSDQDLVYKFLFRMNVKTKQTLPKSGTES